MFYQFVFVFFVLCRKTVKGGFKSRLEKLDYTESDDHVTCKLASGLACNNAQQRDRLCEDYIIRVFCTCEGKLQQV
jgi:hypothetical protein